MRQRNGVLYSFQSYRFQNDFSCAEPRIPPETEPYPNRIEPCFLTELPNLKNPKPFPATERRTEIEPSHRSTRVCENGKSNFIKAMVPMRGKGQSVLTLIHTAKAPGEAKWPRSHATGANGETAARSR